MNIIIHKGTPDYELFLEKRGSRFALGSPYANGSAAAVLCKQTLGNGHTTGYYAQLPVNCEACILLMACK